MQYSNRAWSKRADIMGKRAIKNAQEEGEKERKMMCHYQC